MKTTVIGIDVSKEKLDVCLRSEEKILKEVVVENTAESVKKYLSDLFKECKVEGGQVLVCAEYTGQYTYALSVACEEMRVDLWLENPAQIKLRSGVQRGKNDKTDARRIAEYALRFQDKAKLFILPEKTIATLKQLISERDLYVSDRAKYQGQLSDQKRFMSREDYADKSKRLKSIIHELDKSIAEIEQKTDRLIAGDETLRKQREQLCSIDGVGERIAVKMLVETNAFRDFDNGRKFCCHAGVAPFRYDSGSSIRSRSKVSNRADKSIKSLLHLAALSVATRKTGGELHEYYVRKVAEGKNKMSVLNAVRAKLVLRMFAVIKFNRFYQQNYQFYLG